MARKNIFLISILVIVMLLVSACAAQSNAAASEVEEAPAADAGSGKGNGSGGGNGDGNGQQDAEATAEDESPAAETPALTISGLVETEMSWSENEVKAMDTLDVESTNSKGEADTYTGVLVSDLLALAVPSEDAATVVFTADDGTTAEAALANVMSCADCILSFRNKGGFSSVLPTFGKDLQIKGIVELQVK